MLQLLERWVRLIPFVVDQTGRVAAAAQEAHNVARDFLQNTRAGFEEALDAWHQRQQQDQQEEQAHGTPAHELQIEGPGLGRYAPRG